MTAIDFSVVVPFFNAGRFIERCALALLSQTYPPDRFEILMVDNNSTDRSAHIVRKFDRISLLRETQQGSYAARNRGIQEARGEIVAFTDPDCVPRDNWLEQIGRAMTEPQTKVVLGDRLFATDTGILGMLAAYESALSARIFTEERVDCYYAHTNNMAVRMSFLKALGCFRALQRGADSLFMRCAVDQYGHSVVKYVPQAVVRHLEVASVRDYVEKKGIYGQVNQSRELVTPNALPLGVRLELALRANRERRGSLAHAVGLLAVLAAGAIRFEWERRQGGGNR
jgi:glycosyltransferase involved in cell wall biosynthesis